MATKAIDFYDTWCKVIESYGKELLTVKRWYNTPALKTQLIENTIYKELSKNLGYEHYEGYYHTDTVFYLPQDNIPRTIQPGHTTFLRKIRIAIEHENDFSSGLYKELCHLMIIDCDLRVLITYFNNYPKEKEIEMNKLLQVINGAEDASRFSNEESILFINAAREDTETGFFSIYWEGFIFKNNKWELVGRNLFGRISHSSY